MVTDPYVEATDCAECSTCEGFSKVMPPAEYCISCEFVSADDLEGQHPGGECCECWGLADCPDCAGTGYEPDDDARGRAADAAGDAEREEG